MAASYTASDAKSRFGQVLDDAKVGPVRIRKNGRDVAVVMSVEAYRALTEQGAGPSSAVRALHEKSAERWATVYKALAE